MTALNYVRDLPGGGIVTARVAPHPSSLVLPVASTPMVMGVWQHYELTVGVLRFSWCDFPNWRR